ARARGAWTSVQCLTNCAWVIPALRVSSEMLLITGSPSGPAARRPRLSGARAAAAAPVEEEHLHPIRGGRHGAKTEIAAIAGRDAAEHPGRSRPDDVAGAVQAVDGDLHALDRDARAHVVDLPADHRSRGARRHVVLEPEVSIETLLRIGCRCRIAGRQQRHHRYRESETSSMHRRTSASETRNHGCRFPSPLRSYRVAFTLHAAVEDRAVRPRTAREHDDLGIGRFLSAYRHVVVELRRRRTLLLVDPLLRRAPREQGRHADQGRGASHHSMTRSARWSNDDGIVTGIARAARRLTTSSKRAARRMPRSAGLTPLRI